MLTAFCDWLAQTPPSVLIQTHVWIVIVTQSIHIVMIAVLACAVLAIDLRLLGLTRKGPALAVMERRFMPWIWTAAVGLLLTGLVLVVGEPTRELLHWLFWTKMGLVVLLLALTAVFQTRVRMDATAWDSTPSRKLQARALGAASVLLLLAIITAGRWIAYVLVE